MGIIVNSAITTVHGLELTNTYMSIANNEIRVFLAREGDKEYQINYIITTWKDQASRMANKMSLNTQMRSVRVSEDEINNSSVYTLAYGDLKTVHVDHTNV